MLQKGELDKAVKEYKKALRINPNSADLHYNLGLVYCKYATRYDIRNAINEFKKALSLDPNNADIHMALGNAYAEPVVNKYDKAVAEYRLAIKIKPDLAWAHRNIGLIYWSQKKLDQALLELHEALAINPSLTDALDVCAGIYEAQKDYRKAIECGRVLLEYIRVSKPDDIESVRRIEEKIRDWKKLA
jgi:tetratricopeptide (TPR) repeat protein